MTHGAREYVFLCIGCGALEITSRRDTLTCSGACRVRAHRSGALARLRAVARDLDLTPADILQGRAVQALDPGVMPRVAAGHLTFDQAQADARRAFFELLRREVERDSACNGSGEVLHDRVT